MNGLECALLVGQFVGTRNRTFGRRRRHEIYKSDVNSCGNFILRRRTNTFSEVDACRASGLIALKQRSSEVKNVEIDFDSATIIKADTKIENTPVKAVVLGEAYIERKKGDKPQTFVCVLGEKGKVLLTLFSNQ